MAAMLSVIWWRDIPAQVIAKDRRQSHKIVLHARFQTAIDRAATKAGLKEWNAYLEQWRKEQRPCGDDVKAEAEAEAQRIESEYTKEVLNRLAAAGGLAGADVPEPRPGHLPPPAPEPGSGDTAASGDRR
jgi:cvfA/B/C family virulence factor